MDHEPLLFAGQANSALACSIAQRMRLPLSKVRVERFPDSETSVQLLDPVRGRLVFLIHPTSPPVNENLVELLSFVDAFRRSAAGRIVAVIPYFGYARSDKRHGRREAIGASMVATLLEVVGAHQVMTVDLHAAQIEGFFRIPVDTLSAMPLFCDALSAEDLADAVVVSPDTGRVKVVTEYGQRLQVPVVILHKKRESAMETTVTRVVGNVRGKTCIIIDDMISTGSTIAQAVMALLEAGARTNFIVVATHGPLLSDASKRLNHPAIKRILVTDSIAHTAIDLPQLEIVSIAPLLATAIQRVVSDSSMSDLY